MPQIDFFTAPCALVNGNCQIAGVVCKSTTTSIKFGLCDIPPPVKLPAFIKHYDVDEWIAEVSNPDSKEVTFKAIDNCVPIFRVNNQIESRCDGMLLQENNLTFVELKDRGTNGWLSKGREQLTITLRNFLANNATAFSMTEAYVCNKQRPLAVTGISTEMQKFKDETAIILNNDGLLLKADRIINI